LILTQTRALCYGAADAQRAVQQARTARTQIAAMVAKGDGAQAQALTALDKRIEALRRS
jgi:hypothetical protein